MTNQEIKTVGQTIAQETQIGGNTAARVGGVVEGIGVALDNKDAANGYYQATISGGTITVNAPNYLLGTGGNLRIKMPSAGTGASTLTIGNANAVQLWYNGAAVSSDNTWEADEIISVFYDGTRFMASNSQGGGGAANKISYDNSQSVLSANNVQGALDEVAGNHAYKDAEAQMGGYSYGVIFPISSAWYWYDDGRDKHRVITLQGGEKYIKVTASAAHGAGIGFLKTYTAPTKHQQSIDWCSGYSHSQGPSAGETAIYPIPSDCNYIVVNTTVNNLDYSPAYVGLGISNQEVYDEALKALDGVSDITANDLYGISQGQTGAVISADGTINSNINTMFWRDIIIPDGVKSVNFQTFKTGRNYGCAFMHDEEWVLGYNNTVLETGMRVTVPVPPNANVIRYSYLKDANATSLGVPLFDFIKFIYDGVPANKVFYDNTLSGIEENNAQGAIETLEDMLTNAISVSSVSLPIPSNKSAYYSNVRIGFEAGKRYKITYTTDIAPDTNYGFYIRPDADSQEASQNIGYIRTGQSSGSYIYLCKDDTLQYISVYSWDSRKAINCTAKVEEVSLRKVPYSTQVSAFIVAASNSSDRDKLLADFICDGVNDEVELQRAISSVTKNGAGKVLLCQGDYYIDSFQHPQTNWLDMQSAVFVGDNCKMIDIEGCVGERRTIIHVTSTALENIASQVSVFNITVRNINDLVINYRKLWIEIADINHPVLVINNYYSGASIMQELRLWQAGNGAGMVPAQGSVGIRCSRGNPNGIGQEMTHVGVTGFWEGFQMGGEHLVATECLTRSCHYGYTFGNYNYDVGVMEHPLTLINCCDEASDCLPLFAKCGSASQSNYRGLQQVDLISFNMELRPTQNPSLQQVSPAEELTPSSFCGNITFVANKLPHSLENAVDVQFWKEGSGKNFRTYNMTHKLGGTSSERNTYTPTYMQQYYDTTLQKLLIYNGANWVELGGGVPSVPQYMDRPTTGCHAFSVKVNISIPKLDETDSAAIQDSYTEGTDYGFIMLPTSYTASGEPTRLIITCHGAGASLSDYQSNAWKNFSQTYWCSLGYAIMDMYACPPELSGSTSEMHYGNPTVLECYKKGFDYVMEKFNLRRDGIFVVGSSMGGLSSFQIVDSGMFPVLAQIGNCPCIDIFKQAYCNPWTTATYQRQRIATYFGFEGTAPTWTTSKPPSAAESQYFISNFDKTIGYYPILKNVVGGDISSIFNVIPSSVTAVTDAEEAVLYDALTSIHPCPIKIFHCKDDTTMAYRYSKYFIDMVRRSGQLAYFRPFATGGHSAWDAGNTITVTDIDGNSLTLSASKYEAYLFFKRFDD